MGDRGGLGIEPETRLGLVSQVDDKIVHGATQTSEVFLILPCDQRRLGGA